jgi:hypothetical protein
MGSRGNGNHNVLAQPHTQHITHGTATGGSAGHNTHDPGSLIARPAFEWGDAKRKYGARSPGAVDLNKSRQEDTLMSLLQIDVKRTQAGDQVNIYIFGRCIQCVARYTSDIDALISEGLVFQSEDAGVYTTKAYEVKERPQ